MNKVLHLILAGGLIPLTASSLHASVYKVVVRDGGVKEGYVEDAEFRVLTPANARVLGPVSYDKKTHTYSLEIDEPKLDRAQTLTVRLEVDAPGHIGVSFNLLLGKFDQVIAVALPREERIKMGIIGGIDDASCDAARSTTSERAVGWYFIPILCGPSENGKGIYAYWDGRRWIRQRQE
jgi:hypothetical protein